jgi:Tfp pilus assembly protein PilN
MINLLSDERKDELKAARANTILVRYSVITLFAFAFITGALFVSYTVLESTMASAESRISANDVKSDVYVDTKKEVDGLSSKLTAARPLLDQEVRYSQLLVKLGQLMPAGTVLGDLTLTAANFTGEAVELKAYAKSTAEAGTLQTQFQASPLFSQVTPKSIDTDQQVDGYPVTITMTVTFNKAGI